MTKVSVVIPCLNEERYVIQSLESVIHQDYPSSKLEVYYVDGGSTDSTLSLLADIAKKYDWISIIDNPNKTVPFALNLGIKKATGDLIMRMDVHSHFPPDYISKIVSWHEYLEVDNVGGICHTDVLHQNKISEAIKLVMADKYGVGNSTFRVGTKVLSEVDTVPFGCYKREVFDRIGYFDERLTRNQDIEFNERLKRNGGLIYLVPDVHCTYFARDTYSSLFSNRFKTGMWIVKTSALTRNLRNLSIRHFVPLIFVLAVLLPLLLSFIYLPFAAISALVLLLYILVLGKRAYTIKTAPTKTSFVFLGFLMLHFSYGLGSFYGLKYVIPLYSKGGKK